jgi:hypothetical protein
MINMKNIVLSAAVSRISSMDAMLLDIQALVVKYRER